MPAARPSLAACTDIIDLALRLSARPDGAWKGASWPKVYRFANRMFYARWLYRHRRISDWPPGGRPAWLGEAWR